MSFKGVLSTTGRSTVTLLTFIKNHWYLIVILFFLIPPTLNSIKIAKETANPLYPVLELGTIIINADLILDRDVDTLKTNPQELVGMQLPQEGFFLKIKYYWLFFWNVIFKIAGTILLISLPFRVIYWSLNTMDNTKPAVNFTKAFFFFFIYLFIINLIVTLHGVLIGNQFISLPDGASDFKAYLLISVKVLPFHGLFSLIVYLINL